MSDDPRRPMMSAGADDGGAGCGERPNRQPNLLLKAARERTHSERKPGASMSRPEVTDKANAYIVNRGGAPMDDHVLRKLELGEIRAPRDELRREALRHVLGVKTDAELGWPARRSPIKVTPQRRPAVDYRDRSKAVVAADADLSDMVTETASDTEQVAASTEARTVSPVTLMGYQSRFVRLSKKFVHQPVREVFPELRGLWRELSVHLQHGPRSHQSRDLYLLAGMTCVVLAHACHVLGFSLEGMVQVKAARLWAEEAGHPRLLAWVLGTEALLVETDHGAMAALHVLENAQEVLAKVSRPGTGAVRLACYEARFSAKAGLRDRALAAIRDSEIATEALSASELSDLDGAGGILTFGETKRLSFCAGPFLAFGRHGLAEQHASDAVNGYLGGPADQYSYGDVALARLTVAQARLSSGNLEGVLEAVRPVLTLPHEMRIYPLRDPLGRLATTLEQPRYRRSVEATQIRDNITAFFEPSRAKLCR